MPKAFTLDGAPSGYYKPDREFMRKWAEKQGISADNAEKRNAAASREDRKQNHA